MKDIDSFVELVNTEISADVGDKTMSLAERLIEQGRIASIAESKAEFGSLAKRLKANRNIQKTTLCCKPKK